MIKLHIVTYLLILCFLATTYVFSQPAPAKADTKPVCIEAHLGINKSESIVLCGKVVNLKEIE